MAVSRQPIIGVKNIKYALLTGGDSDTNTIPTYDTVKPLFQVATFGFDPAFAQTTAYYDNGPRFLFSSHGEATVTLEGDNIYPENLAEVLGMTYQNGILVSSTDDEPPYVAIGGEITRSNGVSEYFWIPKVQLGKGPITVNTKQAEVSPQNVAVSGRAVSLVYNDALQVMARSDDANVAAATISGWFNAVVYSTSANLNALGVTGAVEGTDDIIITFAKTGAGNFVLDPATCTTSTIKVLDADDGSVVTAAIGTVSTTPAATQTITVPATLTLAPGDYVVIVDGVKDSNGIECTYFSDLVTIA